MLAVRLIKIAMVASCALFALLVAYGNLVDYDTNYQFVRHTLSMDTTFPGNALMGRAITAAWAWTAGYWLIIATEAVTGLILAIAAIRLLRLSQGPARAFNVAKSWCWWAVGSASCCGSPASWSSAGSGSRCGNRRPGTARPPPSTST